MALRPIPEFGRANHTLVARPRGGTAATARGASTRLQAVRTTWSSRRAARVLSRVAGSLKVCPGSGAAPIEGWINIDMRPPAGVVLDLRYRIPLASGSVDFIYSEHLIEHLTLEDYLRLFAECLRVIKHDGVLWLARHDLAGLVEDYPRDWLRHDALYGWGHLYLYDELRLRRDQAACGHIDRVEFGSSSHHELSGVETRADAKLIVEAQPGDAVGKSRTANRESRAARK